MLSRWNNCTAKATNTVSNTSSPSAIHSTSEEFSRIKPEICPKKSASSGRTTSQCTDSLR